MPEGKGANGRGGPEPALAATRIPVWAYPALTVASLLLGATDLVRGTSALQGIADSDLTNFFFKSATYILNGDPWHMYAVRASGAYPNYNPPLSMFLMAPLLGLARAFGASNYGEVITFVALPFIVLIPILGFITLWALRRLYPEMPETQRFLAFALVTLSPLSWQSISPWYHVEQPLMLCLLIAAILALQGRAAVLGGIFAGLAVLTRTTALMPLLALGVLLLAGRDWKALLRFGGVGSAITLLGLAPFFIVDRADATYSFISWRSTAIIGSDSIWTIFAYNDRDGSLRALVDEVARRLDFYTVVLFILLVAFFAARRFGISAYDREAWAVLAMAALSVPLLSKTVWPYYYLEPFVFILIWEFASMHDRRAGLWRWPVLSLGFLAVAATLSDFIGLHSVGAGDRIAVGVLQFAATVAFVLAIWTRMRAAKSAAMPPALRDIMQGWYRRSFGPRPRNAPARMPQVMRAPVPAPSARQPLWPSDAKAPPSPPSGSAQAPGGQPPYDHPNAPGGPPRPSSGK